MNKKSLSGFVQFSLCLFITKGHMSEIIRHPQKLPPVVPLAESTGVAEKSSNSGEQICEPQETWN